VTWTVGRRIILGFAVSLLLVIVITGIGWWALGRTASAYQAAMEHERDLIVRAYEARGAVRTANNAFLAYVLEPRPTHIESRDSAVASARALFEELLRSSPEETGPWSEASQALDRWAAASAMAMQAAAGGDIDEATRIRTEQATPARENLEDAVDRGVEDAQARTEEQIEAASATTSGSQTALAIALVIAMIGGAIAAYYLYRAISDPLHETSNVLATTAAEILATTTQQASGATQSLTAVTETAATVDEVVQTAEQAAERARAVANSSQRAAEIGRQGRDAIERSGTAMEQVSAQVSAIGDSILQLAEQAQAIGEIITTVNDLAEQTNLLALNAAIEAARAGEQGRGFSVVAGEVRSLAEQSKAATVRVRQILGEIQRATSSAVLSTEQGNKKVEEGVRQVNEAGQTIRQLAEAIMGAAQAAAQISASAGQQSTGMAQIKQAVGSIQQAAQQNLAATRQAEGAAKELNRMGVRLIELIGGNDRQRPQTT
jgi:methyl-accepting chemotaxis protein